MITLSKEDIFKFYNEGFAGPFDAFDAETAAQYRQFLDDNILEKFNDDPAYLTNLHIISKTVFDIITYGPIKNAIQQIIGDNVLLLKASLIPKRSNLESDKVHWHQDSLYRKMHPFNAAAVWLALDDIHESNGCVEVLPGTHWHDVPHIKVEGGYFPFEADPKYFDSSSKTEKLICRAGQFFIFNERIIHRSDVNRGDIKRIALIGRFIGTNVFVKSPKLACILVSGEDKYKFNQSVNKPKEL